MKKTIIKNFVGKVQKAEVIVIADGPNKGEKALKITYIDADINPLMATDEDAKVKVIFSNATAIAQAEAIIAEGKPFPDFRFKKVEVSEMPTFVAIYQEDGTRRDGSTYKKGQQATYPTGGLRLKNEMTVDVLEGGSREEDACDIVMRIIGDATRFAIIDEKTGEIPASATEVVTE